MNTIKLSQTNAIANGVNHTDVFFYHFQHSGSDFLRVIDLGGFTTSGDASGNKGRISLMAEDSFLKVIVREADSVWTDDEIKEAELQNINLVQRYVQAHNSAYMREIDRIGLLGGVAGIGTGLLNHAGFTATSAGSFVLTGNANATANWSFDFVIVS